MEIWYQSDFPSFFALPDFSIAVAMEKPSFSIFLLFRCYGNLLWNSIAVAMEKSLEKTLVGVVC